MELENMKKMAVHRTETTNSSLCCNMIVFNAILVKYIYIQTLAPQSLTYLAKGNFSQCRY